MWQIQIPWKYKYMKIRIQLQGNRLRGPTCVCLSVCQTLTWHPPSESFIFYFYGFPRKPYLSKLFKVVFNIFQSARRRETTNKDFLCSCYYLNIKINKLTMKKKNQLFFLLFHLRMCSSRKSHFWVNLHNNLINYV